MDTAHNTPLGSKPHNSSIEQPLPSKLPVGMPKQLQRHSLNSPAALGCSSPWVLAVLVAAAQNVLPQLLCSCTAATVAALPIRELALGTVPQEQQPSLLLNYVLLFESCIGLSLLLLLLLGGLLMLMLRLSLRMLLMLAGLLLWVLLLVLSRSHGSISTCSTCDAY